ncbi:hypothetical protein F5Y00DRAFT_240305 [Daldinia vernicosa]|uniref:uncharacterized protein n=1 Tax=Daldinia vernicosa TaxID=114800 RepID=UPI002007D573|nr:uncharacterized protein F5Y00DRAFT_240305 [Daldinia vernicosa]KAI0847734.1 hypothetical protein F5Y00DRAFT_240305 [Daldinia vernicosa]
MLGDASGLLFWFRCATCIFRRPSLAVEGGWTTAKAPNLAGGHYLSLLRDSQDLILSTLSDTSLRYPTYNISTLGCMRCFPMGIYYSVSELLQLPPTPKRRTIRL